MSSEIDSDSDHYTTYNQSSSISDDDSDDEFVVSQDSVHSTADEASVDCVYNTDIEVTLSDDDNFSTNGDGDVDDMSNTSVNENDNISTSNDTSESEDNDDNDSANNDISVSDDDIYNTSVNENDNISTSNDTNDSEDNYDNDIANNDTSTDDIDSESDAQEDDSVTSFMETSASEDDSQPMLVEMVHNTHIIDNVTTSSESDNDNIDIGIGFNANNNRRINANLGLTSIPRTYTQEFVNNRSDVERYNYGEVIGDSPVMSDNDAEMVGHDDVPEVSELDESGVVIRNSVTRLLTMQHGQMVEQPWVSQEKRQEAFRQRSWTLEQCSICFEVILKDQEITSLTCTHRFHTSCVLPWLQEHETCPNCRKTINT